jgi:hypothetical protein
MPIIELTSITLKMLLDSHILRPGQVLYPINGNNNVEGIINDDGTISLSIYKSGKRFLSPSGAAKAIENSSINGWTYWGIRENNALVELSVFRSKYHQMNS